MSSPPALDTVLRPRALATTTRARALATTTHPPEPMPAGAKAPPT
jgi:hypothetical protein